MTNETISLIPSGRLKCVVSGKLRLDTPEENVRQRIARSLLDNYGYDKTDIEIEFTINQGSKKPRVDIAIFPPNTVHKQENIKIIIECKKAEVKPTDRDNGIEQLKSYIAACLNARVRASQLGLTSGLRGIYCRVNETRTENSNHIIIVHSSAFHFLTKTTFVSVFAIESIESNAS
jgi:hypothetical protein